MHKDDARTLVPFEGELDEDDLSLALLALGLLQPSAARFTDLGPALNALAATLQRGPWKSDPWRWRWRPAVAALVRGYLDVRELVRLGRQFVGTEHGPNGARVEAAVPTRVDPASLVVRLRRGGVAIHLRWPDRGDVTWRWPLRVAADPGGGLLDAVRPHSSVGRLVHLFPFHPPTIRVQIALIADDLAGACCRLSCFAPCIQADLVVVTGGLGARADVFEDLVTRVRQLTDADAVLACERIDDGAAFVRELFEQLSHDCPLDVAVDRAAGATYAIPVLLFATRRLIRASRVSRQAELLVQRMDRVERPMRLPAITAAKIAPNADHSDFGTRVLDASEVARGIDERVVQPSRSRVFDFAGSVPKGPPILFDRESEGARVVADISEALETVEADEVARDRPLRFVQTQVNTLGGHPIDPSMSMRSGHDYVVALFIGSPRRAWLGLGKPLDEPPPPPDGSPLELDVVFVEPTVCPTPEVRTLRLPALGDSAPVLFSFKTALNPGPFAARIAIYHRHRNLQTGLLTATVGDAPCDLAFTLDAIPVPRFEGLTDRASVGVSIILNDDPHGVMRALVHAEGHVGAGQLSDGPPTAVGIAAGEAALKDLVEALGKTITKITASPGEFLTLASEGNRVLLRDLAQHGGTLLTRLKKHTKMGNRFDTIEYVQIVRAHVDAFFPAEFLYSGAIPEDDAVVCSCLDDPNHVPEVCKESTASPDRTICPLKFWSLSKVIERHAHIPAHTSLATAFELRAGPPSERERVLDVLDGAVLAASSRVDAAVPGTVATLGRALDQHIRRAPASPAVPDWDAWATAVKDRAPRLLVMLPHHDRQGTFDVLEIGNGQTRRSVQIREEHVRPLGASNVHPVVLLIGCETGQARIDLENAVVAFQDAGAAIVVSTIATILGRQAGPVAQALVEELDALYGRSDATFGMAMRSLRRRLLAGGTAMVLGLTSYGDADWRIGSLGDS